MADAGQVLVSQTVRDLVAGSGIVFDNLGKHELRGIEGQWSICSARFNQVIRARMTADRNSSVEIPDVLMNFPTGVGFLSNDDIFPGQRGIAHIAGKCSN